METSSVGFISLLTQAGRKEACNPRSIQCLNSLAFVMLAQQSSDDFQ